MKSKVLAILSVAACFAVLAYISVSEPKASCECVSCTCDPCECKPGECQCPKVQTEAIVENPADDSAKGYITVFVPKNYKGWATTWVTPELKSEYHYTVIPTSSPHFSRFKSSVKHVPGILVQRSSGAIVDEVYSDATSATECCPLWKHRRKPWKKEEQKQEEAPVDEEEAAPAPSPPPPDHTGLWVLLGLAGAATGAAVAWHDRKAKKSKK